MHFVINRMGADGRSGFLPQQKEVSSSSASEEGTVPLASQLTTDCYSLLPVRFWYSYSSRTEVFLREPWSVYCICYVRVYI